MSQTAARWQLLVQRQLWAARKETCNAVWTDWMRSRNPEGVARRLAEVLPLASAQIATSGLSRVLGGHVDAQTGAMQ